MKCFLPILLIVSSTAFSKDERALLKCLGQEERKFHLAKDSGPSYDLNQRLISEMLQIPKADINAADFKDICQNPKISPSWKLLEQSIKKGKVLFHVPNTVTEMQKVMYEGMIEDYMEATKEILLNYITQVQALSPSPTCLKEEIPQLDAFFTDIKYLQEDVDLKKLFDGRDVKIFERLKDYPTAYQKCRERLKKKPKSGSKAVPKKS